MEDIRKVPLEDLTNEEFNRLVKAKIIYYRKRYKFNQPAWNGIFKKYLNKSVRGARIEGMGSITLEMLWVICKVFSLTPVEFFDFTDIPEKFIQPEYGRRK